MDDMNKIIRNTVLAVYKTNDNRIVKRSIKRYFRYLYTGYIFMKKQDELNLNLINKFEYTGLDYKSKYVVYTIIIGEYDKLLEPLYIDPKIDYYAITDQQIPEDSIWKKIDINLFNLKNMSLKEKSRYLKMLPHVVFSKYDYSIYLDGNILITSNLSDLINHMINQNKLLALYKHPSRSCSYEEGRAIIALGKSTRKEVNIQLKSYQKEGFPPQIGLYECNIIVRKHNECGCIKIMEFWWKEYIRHTSKRDQLSFMYSLWKNGYTSKDIACLGTNSRKNTYFLIYNHYVS